MLVKKLVRDGLPHYGMRDLQQVPLKTKVDMEALGSAIHHSIAAYLSSEAATGGEAVAAILKRWRLGAAAEPEAVLAQASVLLKWVHTKWPGARMYVEVPVEVTLKSGRVVRGQVDLLVEATDGWVLIDHKADPRSTGTDDRLAMAHGSQLDAYAEALVEATGRQVVESWLFLPVAGQAAMIDRAEAAEVTAAGDGQAMPVDA